MNNQPGGGLSDHYLVDQVLSGNTQAFGLIIQHTEKLVAQIVFKMIANPSDREDLAQEIYLKAFKKLPAFRFESKLATWIARISYNTCMDHLRKKKLLLAGDDNPMDEDVNMPAVTMTENDLPGKQLAAILQAEIGQLPPVHRTLVSLFHNEELGYEEIAAITGLPLGTVKSYLFRARKTLKERLLVNYKKEDL